MSKTFFDELDELDEIEDDLDAFFSVPAIYLYYEFDGWGIEVLGDGGDEVAAYKAARYLSQDRRFTNVICYTKDDEGQRDRIIYDANAIEMDCDKTRKRYLRRTQQNETN